VALNSFDPLIQFATAICLSEGGGQSDEHAIAEICNPQSQRCRRLSGLEEREHRFSTQN
jgi:hypothetical protein